MITKKELKNVIKYERSTGKFFYKITISRNKKGNEAGHLLKGKKYITLDYRRYNAAKLAWLYVYGEYPKEYLEHINGDYSDLRIKNLKKSVPQEVTYERLREILEYNPITGIFTWILNIAGKKGRAGYQCKSNGYRFIVIDKKRYTEGRLAWFYMEGYWPEKDIDHINRNRSDNRWCNLRHISKSCNSRNQGVKSNNTSGVTGVYYNKNAGKWQSYLNIESKNKYLGIFRYKNDAVMARWQAEKAHGFSNCQTTSSAYLYLKNKGLI